MSIAVAFTTTSTATGYTAHGHVAVGPTGEVVELEPLQALIMGADLRSVDGRVFRIFGWGERGWMLEERP